VTTDVATAELRTGRPWMWARLVGLAALVPAAWALARFDVLPHVKLCMFERVTGRPCPGCGMTRSILDLAQGDVVGSLRMHPLGVVLAGMLVAAIVGTAVGLVRGDDPPARFLERHGMRLVGALVVLFVAQWIVRGFLVPSWSPDAIGGG
jgi:hypothetical protein